MRKGRLFILVLFEWMGWVDKFEIESIRAYLESWSFRIWANCIGCGVPGQAEMFGDELNLTCSGAEDSDAVFCCG